MVETTNFARPRSDASRAWVIGAVLLLASVLVGLAEPVVAIVAFGGIIRPALFCAALLVFAFGIRGAGSVTARRPLGTTALALLAAWLLLGSVLQDIIVLSYSNDPLPDWLQQFGYIDSFVRFALALVAVMQIARAGIVPAPWNWAPAWVVGATSVSWLLMTIVFSSTAPIGNGAAALLSVDVFVRVGGTVFLAILAIVLADRASRPSAPAAPVDIPIRGDVE